MKTHLKFFLAAVTLAAAAVTVAGLAPLGLLALVTGLGFVAVGFTK